VDHATDIIFVEHQALLWTRNTLGSKKKFKEWSRLTAAIKVKKYHADNINFSNVGAHHQNGVPEGAVGTIAEWARTMLLHVILHWPNEVDLCCSFSMVMWFICGTTCRTSTLAYHPLNCTLVRFLRIMIS
jgi:hypothetical protein